MNNIESSISDGITMLSKGWFEGKMRQFITHELYDKRTNSLKYTTL